MVINSPAKLPVTPLVLKEARLRTGLGIQDAIRLINNELARDKELPLEEADLIRWEEGTDRPTAAQAEAVSAVYLISFTALFSSALPPPALTDFRLGISGRTAPLSYATLQRLSRFERLYEAARRVSAALGITEEVFVKRISLPSRWVQEEAEVWSADIRQQLGLDTVQLSWKSDQEALQDVTLRIQDTGVFVFSQPMSVEECRGASKWATAGPPAILLNSSDAPSAQVFTLIHEYSHLTFSNKETLNLCDPSSSSSAREELLANRIAAAALVPLRSLEQLLTAIPQAESYAEWPTDVRQLLRNTFNVSHGVIGIRLEQLGIVEESGYRSFWRQPRTSLRGRNRPRWQRYRRYLGQRATNLAREAIRSEVITATDLARILDIKVKDLERALTAEEPA